MSKINNSKNRLNIFSLFLGITLFLESTTLKQISYSSDLLNKINIIFLCICVCYIFLFFNYNVYWILGVIALLFVFFIVKIRTGSFTFLDLLLTVLFLKDIPLEMILKRMFLIQTMFFFSTIILNILKILPARVLLRNGVIRSSLGFWHPNTPGIILLSLLSLSFILIDNKLKRISLITFFSVVGAGLFTYTNSRSSLLLMIVVLVIGIANSLFSKSKFYVFNWKFFIPIAFLCFTILSYLMSTWYSKGNILLQKLNILLSYRLSLGYKFIKEYGISVFGRHIQYTSTVQGQGNLFSYQYWVLDNVYLKILLNYGIVTIMVLVIYFTLVSLCLNKKQLLSWNAYFIVFIILGFSEQSVFNYVYNFFMLYGVALFSYKNYRKKA